MKKIVLFVVPILALIGIYIFVAPKPQNTSDKLVIYTYSSFSSLWGAGPALKEAFQKKSNIEVEFVDVGEAGTLLLRLGIEKQNSPADIILGLDQFSLKEAESTQLFASYNIQIENPIASLPNTSTATFLAYNWSPMVFIYRKSDFKKVPTHLAELLSDKLKSNIVLYDPKSSTPGYILAHYILDFMGHDKGAQYLKTLRAHALSITPSWSAGYGLFTQKNAMLAFSYLGSPVYHWTEEKNTDYQPLILDEPAPVHIEYAAVLKNSHKQEKAEEFLKFLVSPEAQKIIMTKNYMFPVIEGVVAGTEFEKLKLPKLYNFTDKFEKEQVLKIWNNLK